MIKLKPCLSNPSLFNRYYSLYLIYDCVFWGNYGGPLSPVIKLQNKALGIIDDVPLMEPITPYYAFLNLLKFPDIVKLNTCLLFYDYLNSYESATFTQTVVSVQLKVLAVLDLL